MVSRNQNPHLAHITSRPGIDPQACYNLLECAMVDLSFGEAGPLPHRVASRRKATLRRMIVPLAPFPWATDARALRSGAE